MADLLPVARANVAARLREHAQLAFDRAIESAAAVEAGRQDECWAMRHEVLRLEREQGE